MLRGVAALLLLPAAQATLVLPTAPPRGFNSFDLQVYRRGVYRNGTGGKGPGWNETVYRDTARAMVSQGLLAKGFDTMVIDGGWSGGQMDEFGRSIPDVTNWPSAAGGKGFGPLAEWTHSLGLKMGVWHIRGAPDYAVAAKTPVKGTASTIDQLVWQNGSCPERWCRCTWDQTYLGIDAKHPDAQAYYDSLVDLYAEVPAHLSCPSPCPPPTARPPSPHTRPPPPPFPHASTPPASGAPPLELMSRRGGSGSWTS